MVREFAQKCAAQQPPALGRGTGAPALRSAAIFDNSDWDEVQGAPPALEAGNAEFDSRVPDCDAREQVNPARRERVFDGIVTRASPKRFAVDLSRHYGVVRKAARLPCKQALRGRYPATPPILPS